MHRRTVGAFVAWVVVASLIPILAEAHSGDAVDAEWASVVPTIDGAMDAGEWADSAIVDLGAIPGNNVRAFMLAKNNDTYLWFAYDATEDTTSGSDYAAFALDTGHDGSATDGGEDQFVLQVNLSTHLVYDMGLGDWTAEDSPFDPGLPDHAGLSGAGGFGPSDLSAGFHRVYEFQVPLALLGAAAGDTVGLFGGSQPAPGVYDDAVGYSTWPDRVSAPIPLSQYGDLNLALLPGPVGVSLSPSSASQLGSSGETVFHAFLVRNRGTAGGDTFDITSLSAWTATLWDATGLNPLTDTDGDLVPDTGNVASGGSVGIVVGVDIPPSASGCDAATITATSSVDAAFWDTSMLTTCTGPASLMPPHADYGIDADGDLLFDYIAVDVNVEVSVADFYDVVGGLYSGDGSVYIASDSWYFYAGTGPYIAPLTYDGLQIYAAGLDGPYRLEMELYDDFGTLIDTDVHMTAAYQVSDFDPPPARFTPPHTDRGVDTDVPSNGLYDELEFTAHFQVDQSGYYDLETAVFDSIGNLITYGYTYSWYSAGSRSALLTYTGLDFYTATTDGPYTIEMWLYDDYSGLLDYDTHVTGAYARTDFDPPPVSFTPPHSDYGEDVDLPPDGLYDFLVVSASLNIAEAGDFRVEGYLYGPGGWPPIDEDTVVVTLGPGPTNVELRFSGPAIRREGISGYFEVYLYAEKVGGLNETAYDLYTTGYYDFTGFQPPSALFSPPHGDRAVDVSVPPDGYYDYLIVDASVDVARAGHFTVEAYVEDYYGRFVALVRGSADLAAGRGSVPVPIDGHRIWELYPYMPLYVYLVLIDENENELDWSYYLTSSYDPYDFQPMDADTPTSAASVGGRYLRSSTPIRVGFAASDPSPSDGIASVALYYRYSPGNTTWSPWTHYTAQVGSIGRARFSGTFLFAPPEGDGYYEFYTVAADYGGNVEAQPSAPDARVAAFVPVRLEVTTGSATMTAGGTVGLTVRAVTDAGSPVTLDGELSVALLTSSGAGEFRESGGSPLTQILIPEGASSVSLDYRDTLAGTATLFASASGLGSGSTSISVTPGAPAELTLSPSSASVPAGTSVAFTASVRDAYGNVIPDAAFEWSVEGPGSLSATTGDAATVKATGTGTVRVTAAVGSVSTTAELTAFAPEGVVPVAVVGIGGVIGGLVAGFGIGWLLSRRRKAPPDGASPPRETQPSDAAK